MDQILTLCSPLNLRSRVLSVSIPSHEISWTSVGLPGIIQGTPVVNNNMNSGKQKYVMLTRNTMIQYADKTVKYTGHLTMLNSLTGGIVWTESEGQLVNATLGYGPLAISNTPAFGKYNGMVNKSDILVWNTNVEMGRAKSGHLFAFQFPALFHEAVYQVQDLKSIVLKDVRWSAVAKPLLNENATSLFIGVTGSQVRGWVGDANFDAPASWSAELMTDNEVPLTVTC